MYLSTNETAWDESLSNINGKAYEGWQTDIKNFYPMLKVP